MKSRVLHFALRKPIECILLRAQYSKLRLVFRKLHFVDTAANPFQTNLHNIPILQPHLWFPAHPDTLRRPREDEIARQKRGPLTQECYRLGYPEDHVRRGIVLHHSSVDFGGDTQILWVRNKGGCYDSGTVRSPAVEVFSERPLGATALDLPFAVGDIVADGVA